MNKPLRRHWGKKKKKETEKQWIGRVSPRLCACIVHISETDRENQEQHLQLPSSLHLQLDRLVHHPAEQGQSQRQSHYISKRLFLTPHLTWGC